MRDIPVYDDNYRLADNLAGDIRFDDAGRPFRAVHGLDGKSTARYPLLTPSEYPLRGKGVDNYHYVGYDKSTETFVFLPDSGAKLAYLHNLPSIGPEKSAAEMAPASEPIAPVKLPAPLSPPQPRVYGGIGGTPVGQPLPRRQSTRPDINVAPGSMPDSVLPNLPGGDSTGPALGSLPARPPIPQERPDSQPLPESSAPSGSGSWPYAPPLPRPGGVADIGFPNGVPLTARPGSLFRPRETGGIPGPAMPSASPVFTPPPPRAPVEQTDPLPSPPPVPNPLPKPQTGTAPSVPPLFGPAPLPPPRRIPIPHTPPLFTAPVLPASPPLFRPRLTALPPVFAAGNTEQIGNGYSPVIPPSASPRPSVSPQPRPGTAPPPESWHLAELFRPPTDVRPDYDYNLSMVPFSPFQTLPGRDQILDTLKRYHVLDFLRNSINDVGEMGQGLLQTPQVVWTANSQVNQALFDQAQALLADARGDHAAARATRARANAESGALWQMAKDSVGGDDGLAARAGMLLAHLANTYDTTLDQKTRDDEQEALVKQGRITWRDLWRNAGEHPVQTVLNLTPFAEGAMAVRAGQLGKAAALAKAAGNVERVAELESKIAGIQGLSRKLSGASHQVQNLGTPAAFDAARSLLNEKLGGNLAYRVARRGTNSVFSRGKGIFTAPLFDRRGPGTLFKEQPRNILYTPIEDSVHKHSDQLNHELSQGQFIHRPQRGIRPVVQGNLPVVPPQYARFQKVEDAEAWLRSKGVHIVDFQGHLHIANITTAALAEIEKAGLSYPDGVFVAPNFFLDPDHPSRRGATAAVENAFLAINPTEEYWSDPANIMKIYHGTSPDTRQWSTDHPLHPLFHEAGHWELFRRRGNNIVDEKQLTAHTGATKALARSVSLYAGKSAGEFMSEVLAAIIAGKEVSPEAMELYDAHKGIKVVVSKPSRRIKKTK